MIVIFCLLIVTNLTTNVRLDMALPNKGVSTNYA